jgi:hypothetical protein
MKEQHTISGLLRKRSEIAGKIEHMHRTFNDLIADQDVIDNAIRIIDPSIDLGLTKATGVPPRMGPFSGEMARFVLGHLRQTKEPSTSQNIAYAVMWGRGLNTKNERVVIVIRKRVGACLPKMRMKGLVREVAFTGEYKHSGLVR